ncbi:MAG: phosphate ABC transporter substrate-binding protein PstS [Candidatus Bathyarchaeia archaeon]|jgi:phosphate ABC transporter phosphate-binding protein
MLGEYITLFIYKPQNEGKKTNKTYTILSIATIVIVIAAVFSYMYIVNSSSVTQLTPTPTPTASTNPNPTATPTSSPTSTPTSTASPTPTLTATPSPTPTPSPVSLTGAGATFPYPLLSAMITNYTTSVKPNVQVNYQSIGSGGGISAMQAKTVDFGASDAPLSATDQANVPNALHIPETIGAVTIAYNLPGVQTGIHLTGKVIADIFQGTVTMWNDQEIQSLNTNVTLPAKSILVVHRSDSSGTTFIFTGYLSASSTAWNSSIGQGKSVSWPVGIGSNGNTGVASVVQGQPYAIGYVELAYALQNSMTVAAVQNPAGNWILPSLASTTVAAQSIASAGLPAGNASWTSVNILNAPEPNAYPIVSFTYLLVYKELNVLPDMTQDKATALVQFLWYVVHDGQNLSPGLAYAQLPPNVVQIDETTIKSITFNGQTLPTT